MPLNQSQPIKSVIERAAGILTDEAFIEKDWYVVRAACIGEHENRGRQLEEAVGLEHRENQDREGADDVRKKWFTQDIFYYR